ncbi:alpha/beta hydrolase [Gordonia rubripertincta]|uniref:alpha/beta hydrolase n=1 Tax=Gordonia rubripertincta TaxID=36822 RepID=UPI0015F7CD25|nr:alpha/beta hydrolase [Gordonia rubripertincta]QMU21016.1 alpha/beta hydrolase [Gordonia rubripertincta]
MSYAVDPEYLPMMGHLPQLDIADAAGVRAMMRAMRTGDPMAAIPPGVLVDRRVAPASDGADIELVTFRPEDSAGEALPVVVYFHGGGFVFGDAGTDVRVPSALAAEIGAMVISVNYRLAPEFPYPTPLDDCFDALTWIAGDNDLAIDRDRIAVAGISAGAGLAAGAALRTRDAGGPTICFQALDSPVLDDRLLTVSATEYTDSPLWNRQNAIDSWRHYLGTGAGGDRTPVYAAPARAHDLEGLPAAYIAVSSFDPLRDEGIAYAQRLIQSGVPAELHVFPGTFHGSSGIFPTAAISKRIDAEYTAAIARALKN